MKKKKTGNLLALGLTLATNPRKNYFSFSRRFLKELFDEMYTLSIFIDKDSKWYKNCKNCRKRKCKICGDCPFRKIIELSEE